MAKIAAGAGTLWLLFIFFIPASAHIANKDLAVNEPIRVAFSHPVHGKLTQNVTPSVSGTWQTHKNTLGITSVEFTPSRPLRPGQTYTVKVTGARPIVGPITVGGTHVLSVVTRNLQSVSLVRPVTGRPVQVNADIAVKMPYKNYGTRHLVLFTTDTKLASPDPSSTDDQVFVWHFADPLMQGKTYHLLLMDENLPASSQLVGHITFTTVGEPQISNVTATDHLYPGQSVKIVFAEGMVQSSKAITFDCLGTGKWQDDRTYSFLPATLSPNTTCTYVLHKGVKSKQGGMVEQDRSFTVKSPGAVHVVSASPSGSGLGLNTNISVTFDQPVDRVQAQNAFRVSPNTAGKFTWQGNTMTFEVLGLSYQTTYIASLAAGVASVYGLPSATVWSQQFSTVPQTLKLNVPSYQQSHALGSGLTALRMALAYRGLTKVSDDDILEAIGYNPEPRDTVGNYWTDPYQLFVGDADGEAGVTGWGVYGPPIASAAQTLGRNSVYLSSITVNQVSQAIHDGNPVVVWGIKTGQTPRMDSWNTENGPVSVATNAEVRTVYGVTGTAASPLTFYIHDPSGGDLTWSAAQLQADITAGGWLTAQGVVVF